MTAKPNSQPPTLISAKGRAAPKEDIYPAEEMERLLRDAIRPDGKGEIKIRVLHNVFDWLVVDARERKLLDEPFHEVLEHTIDVHVLTERLGCLVVAKEGLEAVKGDTAAIEEQIKATLTQVRAHREWAVKHLDLMLEMGSLDRTLN
jgi:hypothetical protein